jgi:signal transduction histidine kinase
MASPPKNREALPFKISPRLIDLFGKELVARTEAALAELVKNAYDSDATLVTLRFEDVRTKGGSLIITDNGDGMSLDDLRSKWMVIGTKNKINEPKSRKRRRKVGEKGIGRLGAHKLSNRTILKTKRRGDLEWTVLDIDWSKYNTEDQSFEEITHPCNTEPGKLAEHGTRLELLDLRESFSKDHFQRLQAELTLLVPPLPGIRDFKIEILSDEFPEFRGELKPEILKAATYTVDAEFDGKRLTGILKVRNPPKTIPIDQEIDAPHCGPLNISLYVFVLAKESFEGTPIQQGKVQRVLDVFKGIRIYRDKFKVGTYGDQGNDWLGIDAEHIRRHEVVIHSKQVMGAVQISRDGNPNLTDTTNREGLVANTGFFDLVQVVRSAVNEINLQRWREREIRERQRAKTGGPVEEALTKISGTLDKDLFIPPTIKLEVGDLLNKVRLEQRHELTKMEDELQMYRNLASLGISTAAFAHETEAIGFDLTLFLQELGNAISELKAEDYKRLTPAFNKVSGVAGRSSQLVEMFLEYVRKKKQNLDTISLPDLVEDLFKRYAPFLGEVKTEVTTDAEARRPKFRCVPMDMEAVFLNLLTNAVWATRNRERRRVQVEFSFEAENFQILFSDNGVGIVPERAEKVFLPFFTSKGPTGIGLGLTIVRDTVRKYGGDVTVVTPSKIGGATFQITLPRGNK